MTEMPPTAQPGEEIEYVGAPTEFADAVEMPEWVQTLTKLFFFLPAAVVAASAIPLLLIVVGGALCLCLVLLAMAVRVVV